MVRTSLRHSLFLLAWVVLCLASVGVAAAASGQAVVVAADGDRARLDHGLVVAESYQSAEDSVLVVDLTHGQTVASLRKALSADANIHAVGEVFLASIEPPTVLDPSLSSQHLADAGDAAGIATSPCLDTHVAGDAWAGWAGQTAALLTRVRMAQDAAGHCGEGVTVAVIDTGVDASHPLLEGGVLPGYDFIADQQSLVTEWSALGGSQIAIVENNLRAAATGSQIAIVENSMRKIVQSAGVDGSQIAIVEAGSISVLLAQQDVEAFEDLGLPPLFGHGTMVSGLIRLVAPGARILPLRVFDGYGNADSDDIVRAVYYAVDHGADVINMSFSMERLTPDLSAALRYARKHGVVVAAAAGNRSSNDYTYPAADPAVVGVAASDLADDLADFSNWGSHNADLVAPGVALVSTYPGGLFAAGWGTSFSTPLVSGTAALLRRDMPDDWDTYQDVVADLLAGVALVDLSGEVFTSGRLDAYGAVAEASK